MDTSLLGAPRLYLAMNDEASREFGPHGLALAADDWVGSGTLRNSFFVAPWVELSRARSLALAIDAQGSFRLRVMRASAGRAPELLRELHVEAPVRGTRWLPLGSLSALPADSRLYWHLDAVDDSRVHQISWCTREVPAADTQLAVLMRTWGRTSDLQAQLRRFADGAQADPFHAQVLSRTRFWVLDASPGAEALWPEVDDLGLDLRVIHGPNLGGGGNASHLMALFLADCDARPETAPTDVLLLDDDAVLSAETLARHFAACSLRETPHVSTLPVLQRSQPTTVWEDGGFWGRLNFQAQGEFGRRRNVFPHLLKHGLSLEGYEHLDAFGPLNRCEYATFIFFGLPLAALRQIGLPAAFFLRGDDIEYALRANEHGLSVVSNPNLAAWHEPGHSYAQEYMAILHGLLINFEHSDGGAKELVDWFEQRFAEHGALGDLAGMNLYLRVLESLLDSQSTLLTPQFASHYAAQLPAFQAIACSRLPQAERERIEREARAQGTLLLPFLYPGFHPEAVRHQGVVLCNNTAGSYRALSPCAPLDRLSLHRQALSLLEALVRSFDALQAFWRQRLAQAGTRDFWDQVRQQQAPATRVLRRHDFVWPSASLDAAQVSPAQVVVPSALARVPVHELRRRIECQLHDLSRLRREVRTRPVGGGLPPADTSGGWAARLQAWWRRQRPRAIEPRLSAAPRLPVDFDPSAYLALNDDVARTGMDAGQHYLQHGRREGRRYRT